MPNGQLPSEPRSPAPPNAEPNYRNALARFGADQGKNAPARRRSASRYGWGRNARAPLQVAVESRYGPLDN
jgi:hypothetical protein